MNITIELNQKIETPLGPAVVVWIAEQRGRETKFGLLLTHDDKRIYAVRESVLAASSRATGLVVSAI